MSSSTKGMSQRKSDTAIKILRPIPGRIFQKVVPAAGYERQSEARIAHEVKNPLASIYLNIELLASHLKHIPDEQIRKEALDIAESLMSEIEHLESIAREFLSNRCALRVRLRLQSLSDVLLGLQRFMKKEMESRNVEFVNEIPQDLPKVYFDEERMKEAIMNLYENAADAMPSGGKIKSCVRLSGKWMEIRISDTGHGVSDADAERLFEPFFTTKKAGTGLGLSIVEEILTAHGGSVEFMTDRMEGAVFLLRLPLER